MSEQGRCNDCGGTNGNHFNDCSYDGTSGRGYYSSGGPLKWIILVFVILLIGACVGADPEVLGVIFALPLFVLYVWLFASIFK